MRVTAVVMAVLVLGLVAVALPSNQASAFTRPAEKCGPVEIHQDGTVGPVLCDDGQPNTLVRKDLVSSAPRVMGLGANASWSEVTAAACADYAHATIPLMSDAYSYQFARYRWRWHFISPRTFALRLMDSRLCG